MATPVFACSLSVTGLAVSPAVFIDSSVGSVVRMAARAVRLLSVSRTSQGGANPAYEVLPHADRLQMFGSYATRSAAQVIKRHVGRYWANEPFVDSTMRFHAAALNRSLPVTVPVSCACPEPACIRDLYVLSRSLGKRDSWASASPMKAASTARWTRATMRQRLQRIAMPLPARVVHHAPAPTPTSFFAPCNRAGEHTGVYHT